MRIASLGTGCYPPWWCASSSSRSKLTFLEVHDRVFLRVGQDLCNLGAEVLLESLQLFLLSVRDLRRIPVEHQDVLARRPFGVIGGVARIRKGEALDFFVGENFVELGDQLFVNLVEFLALILGNTQRSRAARERLEALWWSIRRRGVPATGLNGLENFQTVSFSGVTSKTMPTAPALINVFPLGRRWAPEMNHE